MRKDQESGLHESFSRLEAVKTGGERAFGLVFSLLFLLIGLTPLVRGHGAHARLWALAVAVLLLAAALIKPRALSLFHRAWTKLGLLLHAVVSPVVLLLLFYAAVTPFGVCMRLFGKKLLDMRKAPEAETYWIPRNPPGPLPETLKNQF